MRTIKRAKNGRRAFTLVELLIVVIIIGILAGLMLVASGPATRSAEDARAVNDIAVIKKAITVALSETGVSKNQLFIQMQNGSVTIPASPGTSDEQKEALAKNIEAAFDAGAAARDFNAAYDKDGTFSLSYSPKRGDYYPRYYISAEYSDSDIYCLDSASSSPRLVKSFK